MTKSNGFKKGELLVVVCVCGVFAGCNSSSAPADPIKNYRSFIEGEFSRLEQSKFKVVRKSDYKLKVEKSHSLESPFIGTCNVDTAWIKANNDGREITTYLRLEIKYGLKEGKWGLMNGQYKIISPELYYNKPQTFAWSFANSGTNDGLFGSGKFQSLDGLGDALY